MRPIFSPEIFGITINITSSILIQWCVILILGIGAFLLTRNLKLKPNKTQSALEKLYQSIRELVLGIMGDEYESFLPYIGTLMIYLLTLNLSGLLGVKPPTADLSVTLSLAIVTFLVVNLNAIKKHGMVAYGRGLLHPYAFMLPINVMERFVLLVSLSLRLYGNMMAAVVLVELVYHALGSIGALAQFGSPIIVHLYFDLFDGALQMIVFSMLTMINIKVTAEH
ncbi:ATP synthase subunit a [Clostridium puniceum]|uniref:ATP synthase subunit a n=1 Tax=Clostridium puniceum TaxID=29367 RepID=A0A1S8SZV2_9CLOT|nr:F0F1 ATP synthase subunit A [Clostridium puniceum]OOM71057.1 ATP synthase subunit a [Clostridium puniceum]